jgi:hypothetical protein
VAELSRFEKLNFDISPRETIHRVGEEISIHWVASLPGFVLEDNDDVIQGPWLPVQEPIEIENGLSTVTLGGTAKQKLFRLTRPVEVGLTLSTETDAVDLNPGRPGIQVAAGTTVQYSGSASDSSGETITWQWVYTVDGGPWNVLQTGTGPVPSVSFTFGEDSAGSTYGWTLIVSCGPRSAQSHATLTVE